MVSQINPKLVQLAPPERLSAPHNRAGSAANTADKANPAAAPVVSLPPQRDPSATSATAIDSEALTQAVQKIEKNAQQLQRSLQFSIDEISGKTVITVVDRQTEEVIRQIPQEEVLSLLNHFGPVHGSLVETKA